MLNEAINITRSRRGGPHRIKDIGELVAHIGLDKTAGGDGQCAEVALVRKRAFTAVLTIILRSDPHSRAGVLSPGLSANQLER